MANSNWTMPVMAVSQAIASPSPVAWLKLFFKNEEDLNLYRYVALVASLILFHYSMTGFIGPGSLRGKIFTPLFMEENFKTEHERHFGETTAKDLPKGGYPDMGSGRYSDKLSYKDWYNFNKSQRIHYHFLESVTCVICWLLIAGIRYPIPAIAFGAGYILGRIIFHLGYQIKGPRGRTIGFLLQLLCSVTLFGFAFASCIEASAKTTLL